MRPSPTVHSVEYLGPLRRDLWIALGITLVGLLVYTAALAPDILYGDSAEFQTLAYTWGSSHTTGYPLYLILARIVGLIPLNSPAWRINFFSALCGAIILGEIYLLARPIARRSAALLACAVLLLAYTLWSQSIIAEVYTPASAVMLLILLLLLRWSEMPEQRQYLLFAAAFLLTAGMGLHLFTMVVIAPAVGLFVGWRILAGGMRRWRQIALFAFGLVDGFILFYGLFVFIDSQAAPVNYFDSVMIPSRAAWGLRWEDLDSHIERFWISISGLQWRDRMLSPHLNITEEARQFVETHLAREFSSLALLLALVGIPAALWNRPRKAVLPLLAFVFAFALALVYQPEDKFIFYLPAYLMLAIFMAAGADWLLMRLPSVRRRGLLEGLLVILLLVLCIAPFAASRWEGVRSGASTFIKQTYPYPEDMAEPRLLAECVLEQLKPDALLLFDWRQMWATAYLAHAEARRPDIQVWEAFPYGTAGLNASMYESIEAAFRQGLPIYSNRDEPQHLRDTYRLIRSGRVCPGRFILYELKKQP